MTTPDGSAPVTDRSLAFEWRGEVTNDEINILHAEAFEHRVLDDDWLTHLEALSLGWVTARDAVGLVGFVNIIWDGGVHAFIEDTAVAVRARRRGIGRRLIEIAREHSTAAGCEWLHVDFDDHLREFYFDACGFAPTNAGLMRLRCSTSRAHTDDSPGRADDGPGNRGRQPSQRGRRPRPQRTVGVSPDNRGRGKVSRATANGSPGRCERQPTLPMVCHRADRCDRREHPCASAGNSATMR